MSLRVYVYGPRRSGLHAVAYWMLRHAYEARSLAELDHGRRYANNIARPWRSARYVAWAGPMQVIGHEVWDPQDAPGALYHDPSPAYPRNLAVVLLRDPANWLASLRRLGIFQERFIRLWVSLAEKFFLREAQTPGVLAVRFNAWFTERPERERISAHLGLPFTDAGLQHVPHYGSGSSFDRRAFEGRAGEMKVLERWTRERDFVAQWTGRYPVLLDYSQRIFGWAPDLAAVAGAGASQA